MEKRSTKKCNRTKSCVLQGESLKKILILSGIRKGSGNLRVRPYPVKLPACEKDVKKSTAREGNQADTKLVQMPSRDTCSAMLRVALCTTARNGTDEWIMKMRYMYTMKSCKEN